MTGVCGSGGGGTQGPKPEPEAGAGAEEALQRLETELGSQTQLAEIPAQLPLPGAWSTYLQGSEWFPSL